MGPITHWNVPSIKVSKGMKDIWNCREPFIFFLENFQKMFWHPFVVSIV